MKFLESTLVVLMLSLILATLIVYILAPNELQPLVKPKSSTYPSTTYTEERTFQDIPTTLRSIEYSGGSV
jgi:YbbR domain-containing protein